MVAAFLGFCWNHVGISYCVRRFDGYLVCLVLHYPDDEQKVTCHDAINTFVT